MKTLLLVALIATPALAGELPLNPIYGTPEACQNFAIGGAEAVEAANGGTDEDPYMLVTPTQLIGFEWGCDLSGNLPVCWESGDTYSMPLDISLRGDALILNGVELHPCPADDNAIM